MPSRSNIYTSEFKVPPRGYVKLLGPKITLNLKEADPIETLKLIAKLGNYGIIIIQDKDSKKDEKPKTRTVDNIVNNPNPAWTKQPKQLKDDDYKSFYRELYPMQFEEPLFNIHLNVDYPFNLTGILYFPKLNNDINIQKDKIQLYQNS